MYKHAFRNALIPIVTVIALRLRTLFTGAVLVESVFAWPGMGRLGYEAIMNYDYPVVMGVGVIATFLTLQKAKIFLLIEHIFQSFIPVHV